ncbi:MAG: hypothetical protein ACI8P0_001333 [Planctomycetaceae bacterium]|jgi:hypothetical protein
MSTSSNQWYVEMSAGITLGPMPFDAIVELAETSAIMRDDRVREESSKDWKSAHDVPGLFVDGGSADLGSGDLSSGVVSLSGFEVAEPSTEPRTQEPLKSKEPATPPEATDGVVRLGKFRVLLGESETTTENDDDPASALLRAASSLETVEPKPVPAKKVKPLGKKQPEQRETSKPDSSLEIPDDGIPALDIPALDIPALDIPALDIPALDIPALDIPAEMPTGGSPALDPPSHPLDIPESQSVASQPRPIEPDTREAPAPLDLAALINAGVEDGAPPTHPAPAPAATPPPFKPPIKPWKPPVDQFKSLAVRGGLALAAVVVVWTLASLVMPDMEEATYDQYAAIYLEYQSLTETPDSGSWSEFATRAKAELDDSLPQLEAAAVPGERSKSLLLYAGRDLRTALNLTPGANNPHAKRLAGFFEQLNELHASN